MPVKVYSADWCPSCVTLKESLQQHGVPYEVVDVDENPEAMTGLLSQGIRTIPVIERPQEDGTVQLYVGLPQLQEFLNER
ncbi:glutaredoxin family protein [Amphritea sp. HPY]|uniref:glutaredoxin family protein n=1 Tax=Amphritea sp. HPY TaxID=3421652 RepID=UPI003D7D305C